MSIHAFIQTLTEIETPLYYLLEHDSEVVMHVITDEACITYSLEHCDYDDNLICELEIKKRRHDPYWLGSILSAASPFKYNEITREQAVAKLVDMRRQVEGSALE